MAGGRFCTKLGNPLTDPMVHFNVGCIIMVILKNLHDPDLIYNNLTHPFFVVFTIFWLLCELYPQFLSIFFDMFLPVDHDKNNSTNSSHPNQLSVQLSTSQSIITRWYLYNSLFVHFFMDVASGLLKLWPLMSMEFEKLDTRFATPFEHKGMIATMEVTSELLVSTPLCLVAYYGYRCHVQRVNGTHAIYPAWLYCLEIIIGVVQLTGTYYYNGTEIVMILLGNGMESVPVDYNLEFTIDYIIYFWFSFVLAPIIWVVVPFWMVKRAVKDVIALTKDEKRGRINSKITG